MMEPVVLDFTSQLDYVRALLPEIVLSLGAIAVLLVDVYQRGERSGGSAPSVRRIAMGALVLAALSNLSLLWLESSGAGGIVALDGYRAASNFVFLGAALIGILLAVDYLERESMQIGEFYALVLFATVGMMVLAGARDLILVFLGLELMSISVYVLTGFNRRDPRSAEAGLKYFLIGAFASAFFVYGVALLYGVTGTTRLGAMGGAVTEATAAGNPILLAGVGLLLVGFGFKVAAVPFHMWAPDAYEGAPTPVTGFMAAGVKAAAFLALVRVVAVHLEPAREIWTTVLWWLAFLSMVVPNFVALAQDDVKRMLAYSSLAHAGYVLVGITSGVELGLSAALFYLAVYTLMTLGSFAVVYVVAGKGDRRSALSDFRGLGWTRPYLGAALLIFLLSLAGFPPTGGFVGKLYLLRAAVDGGRITLAVTLVLTSLVSYYYYLRVAWKMYFEEAPEAAVRPGRTGRSFRWATALCVAGVLLSGLLPGAGISSAEKATASLVERAPAAVERAVGEERDPGEAVRPR